VKIDESEAIFRLRPVLCRYRLIVTVLSTEKMKPVAPSETSEYQTQLPFLFIRRTVRAWLTSSRPVWPDYLKAAADLGHSDAQARYAECRNWAFFGTQDNSKCYK
jgi:hypothetical protein